jgi:hypothetical protein
VLKAYLVQTDEKHQMLYPEAALRATGALDKLDQVFPMGGQWHEIHLQDPWLTEHAMKVKALMLERDKDTGAVRSNQEKFAGALVQVGVLSWTFPYGADMTGFGQMRPSVSRVVGAMIAEELYGEGDDPFVAWLSANKPIEFEPVAAT